LDGCGRGRDGLLGGGRDRLRGGPFFGRGLGRVRRRGLLFVSFWTRFFGVAAERHGQQAGTDAGVSGAMAGACHA